MSNLKKEIGDRIRFRRRECGMKQYELAEILDISNNHLSSIENGKKNMSHELMIKVCDELMVTPDYLLMGSLHSNNIPLDIYERLRTLDEGNLALAKDIIEAISRRQGANKSRESTS